MPAIMRRRDRTVDKANPIFFCASLKRARAKLLAIVDVNGVRKPACGPITFDSEPGKTSLLRQHEVLDRQRNRRDGRRLQRQIEPATIRLATSIASVSHGLSKAGGTPDRRR